MIRARFTVTSDGSAEGFEISGHSGFAEEGSDIVCAAVSSAAYMCVNTLTEIQHLTPEISEADGLLTLKLDAQQTGEAQTVMKGFLLHLEQLSQQYPDYITIERGAKNA